MLSFNTDNIQCTKLYIKLVHLLYVNHTFVNLRVPINKLYRTSCISLYQGIFLAFSFLCAFLSFTFWCFLSKFCINFKIPYFMLIYLTVLANSFYSKRQYVTIFSRGSWDMSFKDFRKPLYICLKYMWEAGEAAWPTKILASNPQPENPKDRGREWTTSSHSLTSAHVLWGVCVCVILKLHNFKRKQNASWRGLSIERDSYLFCVIKIFATLSNLLHSLIHSFIPPPNVFLWQDLKIQDFNSKFTRMNNCV